MVDKFKIVMNLYQNYYTFLEYREHYTHKEIDFIDQKLKAELERAKNDCLND